MAQQETFTTPEGTFILGDDGTFVLLGGEGQDPPPLPIEAAPEESGFQLPEQFDIPNEGDDLGQLLETGEAFGQLPRDQQIAHLMKLGGEGLALGGGLVPHPAVRFPAVAAGGALRGLGEERLNPEGGGALGGAVGELALEAAGPVISRIGRAATPLAVKMAGMRGRQASQASEAFGRQLDRTPGGERPQVLGAPGRAADTRRRVGGTLEASQQANPTRLNIMGEGPGAGPGFTGATQKLQERAATGRNPVRRQRRLQGAEDDLIQGQLELRENRFPDGSLLDRETMSVRELGELTSARGAESRPVFAARDRGDLVTPEMLESAQESDAFRGRGRDILREFDSDSEPIFSELSDLSTIQDAIQAGGGVRARPFGSAMGAAVRGGLGAGIGGSAALALGLDPRTASAITSMLGITAGSPGGLQSGGNFLARQGGKLPTGVRASDIGALFNELLAELEEER